MRSLPPVLLIILALVLVGCGGGEGTDDDLAVGDRLSDDPDPTDNPSDNANLSDESADESTTEAVASESDATVDTSTETTEDDVLDLTDTSDPAVPVVDPPDSSAWADALADIKQARARWLGNQPATYSYTVTIGPTTDDQVGCGNGTVRAVVVDGAVTQARDIDWHCDVPQASVATIDEIFDLALETAGALDGPIGFDPEYGYITSYYAVDRSVERRIGVSALTPGAFPLETGGESAFTAAKARWEAAGIANYTATVDVRCLCEVQGPIDVTVEDGLVIAVSKEASAAYPLRVEEMFATIEPLLAGEHAEIAYHPELGYPVAAILDPSSDVSDDEFAYAITRLLPAP